MVCNIRTSFFGVDGNGCGLNHALNDQLKHKTDGSGQTRSTQGILSVSSDMDIVLFQRVLGPKAG